MKEITCLTILVFFILFTAAAECLNLETIKRQHRLFIGPEVYYSKRTKEGGAHQDGWLYGGHGTFERRKHGGLYYAIDGYYATGDMKGKTAAGKTLKSEITDREIEGRLGYSLCIKSWKKLNIIPYGTYGDFYCTNDFKKPSPLPCTYHEHYQYAGGGLDVSFFPAPCLECGVNAAAKYMLNGKCKIKDDPDYDDLNLIIESKLQYEIDLNFRYFTVWKNKPINALFTPFYRYRHFGGRMNWPFDYIDTKFKNYGARILLNIIF